MSKAVVKDRQKEMKEASDWLAAISAETFWKAQMSIFNDVQYIGFDPMYLLAVLRARAGRRDFDADAALLAGVVAVRGTSLKKILAKTDENFIKTTLQPLLDTYQIVNKPDSPSSATLGRIGSLFCYPIAYASFKGFTTPVVKRASLDPNYPLAMMIASFGSLIPQRLPRQEDVDCLLDGYLAHQRAFDAIINTVGSRSEVSKLQGYLEAAWNSNVYSEEQRRKYCVELGILTINAAGAAGLIDSVRNALVAAAKKQLTVVSETAKILAMFPTGSDQ